MSVAPGKIEDMNEQLAQGLSDTVDTVRGLVAGITEGDSLLAGSDAALVDTAALAGDLHRLAEALLIEATGEIARRSSHPDRAERLSTRMGCHNPNELLQRLTRQAPATVTRWMKAAAATGMGQSLTGESLPAQFPATRQALLAGEVGLDGVLAIAGPLTEVSRRVGREHILLADEVLAGHATGTSPDAAAPVGPAAGADELKMHAVAWATALDQDGAEPTEAVATRRRGITLGAPRDGLVSVRGHLLTEVAAQLQRTMDACESPYVDDADGVQFRPSAPIPVPGAGDDEDGAILDTRTRAQKLHDALATAVFVAAASEELPTIGGAAPTLVVSVDEGDLESGTGHAHIDGADQAVSVNVARHVACAGVVQRVTLARNGKIVKIGTEQRVFNRHQRRAIALRDGGCIIPGCGVPAAWCEIHHVEDHAKGGPTHTDNGVLLCWFHHRFIDTGPWKVRMNRGTPEVQAPIWFDHTGKWRPVTKSRTRMLSIIGRRT